MVLKRYYSIKEAAEYLTDQSDEEISENDVLDLAARGSIRLCIWLQCKVAIFTKSVDGYPELNLFCVNKRFKGYVQIPEDTISPKHEDFLIKYAEPVEPYKEKNNAQVLSESTIQSKKVVSPIKNSEKFNSEIILSTNEEILKSIEYDPINVRTEEAVIPAQDLLNFTEKNKKQSPNIQQVMPANDKTTNKSSKFEHIKIPEGDEEKLLKLAADDKIILYAMLRSHKAKLKAFPWIKAPKLGRRECNKACIVPVFSSVATELLGYHNAIVERYFAADTDDDTNPLYDHYYELEKPQEISREQLFQKVELPIDTQQKNTGDGQQFPTSNNNAKGIGKNEVIRAFSGVHFHGESWRKSLSSPPDWLKRCRVMKGIKGNNKQSTIWNPISIALELATKDIKIEKLDEVFKKLPDWKEVWTDESHLLR